MNKTTDNTDIDEYEFRSIVCVCCRRINLTDKNYEMCVKCYYFACEKCIRHCSEAKCRNPMCKNCFLKNEFTCVKK